MTPLQILATKIAEKHAAWDWLKRGANGKGFKHPAPTFSAYPAGLEITVSYHDHRANRNYRHSRVRARILPDSLRYWIEVSVTDLHARFGKKSILRMEAIPESDQCFEQLKNAIGDIAKRARTFVKSPDKLSKNASTLATAELL